MAKVKTKEPSDAKETEVKDTDTSAVAEGNGTDTKDSGTSEAKEAEKTETKTDGASRAPKDKMSKHEQKCIELALRYFKNYKGEKVLHITSDYQVFLSHNKGLALAHQRTIPEGVLTTVSAEGKIVR